MSTATPLYRGHRYPAEIINGNLDEVFIKINGVTHYLWRAVDQDGNVLDVLVAA